MAITAGSSLNSVPAPQQVALTTNYIDFRDGSTGWEQQYLPDLMEKEAEVFGNRTIGGFLSQVGAEEPMSSDQVIWSEQGRLHKSYTGTVSTAATSRVTIAADIDGTSGFTAAAHGLRIGDTILVSSATKTAVCYVSAHVSSTIVTALPYKFENLDDAGFSDSDACTVLVFGSEFSKGTTGRSATSADSNQGTGNIVEPAFTSFSNKPIIIKDVYGVSGSDASAIGWVEVSNEDGTGGYLWYLKAESETRMRFADQLEMSMLESVEGDVGTGTGNSQVDTILNTSTATAFGTMGLWEAVSTRGNASSGITGVNAATDLAEFDAIIAEFDKQGAIEENMVFVNRGTSLAIDDMLASMNSYGAGGTSYGVFSNSEQMALNLGFAGFRRGSYDFYKSDMRYLNDKSTRGGINDRDTVNAIRGCFIPAGVTSVYDQMLGKNLKRPFLHVRYRASQMEDRRMKTWITGSVGAATSALDAMSIHMLSERCLITQGANNFMLMK